MRIQAAIFDLDGTLLESQGMWRRVDEAFCARRGLCFDLEYAQALKTLDLRQAAEYTIRYFGLAEAPEALMAEWMQTAQAEYRFRLPAKPAALAALRHLSASGVRLAFATASDAAFSYPALCRTGLRRYFQTGVSAGERSGRKNDPALYRLAAARLGVPPAACAVFDDVAAPLLAAADAGMLTVGVWDRQQAPELAALSAAASGRLLWHLGQLRNLWPLWTEDVS